MAKDKEPDRGSKSESFPGGTKASDLPASVGGTANKSDGGATNPPHPVNQPATNPPPNTPHAPVTTDAAAKTPPTPPTGPQSELDVPGNDTRATGARVSKSGLVGGVRDDDDWHDDGPKPARMERPERFDVSDIVSGTQEFTRAIKSRQPGQAFKIGAELAAAYGGLMDSGAFGKFKSTPESAHVKGSVLQTADSVGAELESARNDLSQLHTHGAKAAWAGGGPDPTSGSPMPQGTVPESEAAGFFDPQLLLTMYEVVVKIWRHFQANRGQR